MADDVPTDPQDIDRRLGSEGRAVLLALARRAALAAARGARREEPAAVAGAGISLYGAFVSLHRGDTLRGCIGILGRPGSAAALVAEAAEAATTRDPRFPPVREDELASLTIEVSLLTPLEWLDPAAIPAAVVVGLHGLVIEKGPFRGLLLPQVASERAWTAGRFLDETCRKAGLPPGAWREGARVARFAALVFGEAPS
jgi:AmmeMemoRadiSam system protein A